MKKNRLKEKSWVIRTMFTVIICFGMAVSGFAQTKTIKGVVTDASTGEPIIGASVAIPGTSRGIATGMEGEFTLEADPKETFTVSYLGYVTLKVSVGNNANFNIKLELDETSLDEVIIIGNLSQKKLTQTGSVSSVTSKDIAVTKNENVLNALAGKLPGVRITQKSSQPGAYDTEIDIRGLGTPLFVIDGVQRNKDYFTRMDPEEIESVSVLKDGTAAIYGLRAANGVILITTKQGENLNGKVDISYSSNFTFQQFLYVPEAVDAIEYYTLINEQAWANFGANYFRLQPASKDYDTFIKPFATGERQSTNWINAVFKKTSPQQQHNFGINGGSEKLRYYLNLSYFQQDGNYQSGDIWDKRYNFRSNIDAQITKRLKARVSLAAVLGETQNPRTDWSLYKNVWLTKSAAPVYANDNPLYYNGDNTILQDGNNMVAMTRKDLNGYNLNYRRTMNSGITLTYDVPGIKGLSAKGMFDYNMSLPSSRSYAGKYNLYNYNAINDTYDAISKGSNPATTSRNFDFAYDTDIQLGLIYTAKFGDHGINSALTFEEAYNSWGWGVSAQREIFYNSDQIAIAAETNQKGSGGKPVERASQGFIGQFNYDYTGKYIASFMFRYDGSSKFPAGARWGFFPSGQLAYRISEEPFLKNRIDFLSDLKLRASYGEMGDDSGGGDYAPIFTAYNPTNDRAWYYGQDETALTSGLNYPGIINPNLTWYKTKLSNLAIDYNLWKGLLSGTFEIWQRDRTGLKAKRVAVIPGTVGADLPDENLNSDRNYGWEIELKHRNKVGKVNYFVNAQISATQGQRMNWIENPANNSYDYWRNRSDHRNTNIWWTREQAGMWTSLEQIRNSTIPVAQDALPGDWYGRDWNGDGVVNDQDQYPYASYGMPVFNYGINTGASYNNFDLALNFQGAYGVYASYDEVFTEALPFGGANALDQWMDRWHPVDPMADKWAMDTQWVEGYYPVTGRNGRTSQSNNVINTSYLRLKTLEIGYTVPKAILAKAGIKNLRIYVSGYNLLTFSPLRNVDPERPGRFGGASDNATVGNGGSISFYNYPINRTYTLGLNLKF